MALELSTRLNNDAARTAVNGLLPLGPIFYKQDLNFQKVKDVFETAVKATRPSDVERIGRLKTLVTAFKQYVLGTFIEKYRPGYDSAKAGVQTLTEAAFAKLGYVNSETLLNRTNSPRLKEIREILSKSYRAEEKRPEYFDWLDFTKDGVVKSSLAQAKQAAQQLKAEGFTHALVMGMGGSSMCAKLLNNAFDSDVKQGGLKIETMDNMDPKTLSEKLQRLPQPIDDRENYKTAYVIVSKSGTTFEALHTVQAIIDHLRTIYKHGDSLQQALKAFAERVVFITQPREYTYNTLKGTEPNSNKEREKTETLNVLAEQLEAKTGIKPKLIVHPPRVGGRYSLFSPVGMFISELMGLKTDEFLAGAEECLKEFFDSDDFKNSSAVQYAVLDFLAAQHSGNFAARYVMPYSDRLTAVPEFTAQLAGESNNKDGVHALNQMWGRGPTAHHSDVEALCREDQRRILFEEILVRDNKDDRVHGDTGLESLQDYKLKSMHQDMLTKLALPFGRHLRDRKNNPVISTVLDKIDERNLGYLMMRNMLATVIQSGLQNGDVIANLDQSVKQAQVETFKKVKQQDAKELGLETVELNTLAA